MAPQRLRRFFNKSDTGYQIAGSLRDACIFARHDVTRDPPFSRVDLISCRNLLIYLSASLQRRVIPILHYALRPAGILMLGSSESVGDFSDLFTLMEKRSRIYRKKSVATQLPASYGAFHFPTRRGFGEAEPPPAQPTAFDPVRQAERIILDRYAPCAVVVDQRLEILHFSGRTGRFLEPAPGRAELNLVRMVRAPLLLPVRHAIHQVAQSGVPFRHERLRADLNGESLDVSIEVFPLRRPGAEVNHFLILYRSARDDGRAEPRGFRCPDRAPTPDCRREGSRAEGEGSRAEVARLEEDLAATRMSLQSIIEEHETANEDLRAANEEIQSSNEELQSTNEELETAKEELQSTNEELTTLNEELENRNAALGRSADDLNNLLASAHIPVVMLDAGLRIRMYTPPAETLMGLRAGDIGRPLGELKLGIELPDLERHVVQVIEDLKPVEQTTRARGAQTVYSLRIRPYRTSDHRIDGAVLALVDITAQTRATEQAERAERLSRSIVDTVREPLLVLDAELRVIAAGRSFLNFFRVSGEEVIGRRIYELGESQWDIPALRDLLEGVFPGDDTFGDFLADLNFPRIGRRIMRLNGRRIPGDAEQATLILLTMEDVTDEHEGQSGP